MIHAPLYECPLKDDGVVALSIEFFDDPHPCEIHRGAVRWRVMDDLRDRSDGSWIDIDSLSEEIRLVMPAEAAKIRVAPYTKD